MKRTKKVGITGRYGPRYGVGNKTELKKIELKQKAMYVCPSCKRKTLGRGPVGIWVCKKCKSKFAGGAYSPTTETTEVE